MAALALACAAPSRHLTTRQVDDPMVLPRGLASFTASSAVTRFTTSRSDSWTLLPIFRLGLTDRLELTNASLRYAFLDDAPSPGGATPDGRRRGPLSLALQAGLEGFGWSSLDGYIIIPAAAFSARKHLDARAYLWASLEWTGAWLTEQQTVFARNSEPLWPTGRSSRVALEAGALIQTVDRLAVSVGAGADQLYGCFAPTCDWASRGLRGYGGPIFRPWRWMDVGLFGTYGRRERGDTLIVPNPDPSMTPAPLQRISWLALTAALTFRW